jgi:hypothetical protein
MSAPVHLKPDLTVPLTADNKAAKIAVVLLAGYLLFINIAKLNCLALERCVRKNMISTVTDGRRDQNYRL